MRSMRRLLALAFFAVACTQPSSTDVGATPPLSPSPVPRPAEAPQPEAEPAPIEPVAKTAATLQYVEIVLGDAEADAQLPMIVAIHGLGDRPADFAHLFDTFVEPARLVLPQGIDATEDGGYSWFPIRARDADVEALAQGISTASDRLADAIAVLRRERPTIGTPIVTGFSQGGMLAFALAVNYPEHVASAMPIGGWLPPPLVPTQKRTDATYPIIDAYHGTDDRAVRYEPTKSAVASLVALGLTVRLHTYEGVGHVITPEIQRDVMDAIADALHRGARPAE